MENKLKFFKSKKSNTVIELLYTNNESELIDNDLFKEIKANNTDAALEKHVPQVEVAENKVNVTVGSTIHPMSEEHLITFIILHTNLGVYRVNLTHSDEPKYTFLLKENEKPLEVYEYCNLHGLWVKTL